MRQSPFCNVCSKLILRILRISCKTHKMVAQRNRMASKIKDKNTRNANESIQLQHKGAEMQHNLLHSKLLLRSAGHYAKGQIRAYMEE